MKVHVWGTRGSAPAPFSNRMLYGGNTTCISVETEKSVLVFDAGTGIVALGNDLETEKDIHIFLSHVHLDHIQGLCMFAPFLNRDREIHIYGEARNGQDILAQLKHMMQKPYWPFSLEDVPCRIQSHTFQAGDPLEPERGITIETRRSSHPDLCTLYRLLAFGNSVVFAYDHEIGRSKETDALVDRWAETSDLLFLDGTYTEAEYELFRGYGHSSWGAAKQMEDRCHVKNMLLIHHKWDRSDEELLREERRVRTGLRFAGEGMEIIL